MPPPLKTTGRITRIIRRALTSLLPDSYPTIDDPTSGSVVPGGAPLTVTVSTNRPDLTHTVRLITTDASGTVLHSVPVNFPNGDSPGTATVDIPAADPTNDIEYFIEVVPSTGPSHRIVVTVLKAGTPLTVAVDSGGNPPGTYASPLELHLVGVASGGTPPYTYQWTSYDNVLSSTDTLSITLENSGTYTFTCRATDAVPDTATVDVVYTIT